MQSTHSIWTCGCGRLNAADSRFCGACGGVLGGGSGEGDEERPDRSGEVLSGRFTLHRKLGEGGMGEVYLAYDHQLGRWLAIKLLTPELMRNERARQRMIQEGQTLARIDDVNVVKVFDMVEAADDRGGRTLAMLMEYMPSGDLRGRLKQGPLPWREACAIVAGVLSGLTAIHAEGLVHRDIKPGNILLTANGTPKVADLGVARDMSGRMQTRTGQAIGTSEYMSPEQVKGEKVDERSDVYGVGLLLYELVVGHSPFAGGSEYDMQAAHVQENPKLKKVVEYGAAHIEPVLAMALNKKRSARYQSAEDMRLALVTALEHRDEAAVLQAEQQHEISCEEHQTPSPATEKSESLNFGALLLMLVMGPALRWWTWAGELPDWTPKLSILNFDWLPLAPDGMWSWGYWLWPGLLALIGTVSLESDNGFEEGASIAILEAIVLGLIGGLLYGWIV